MHGFILRLGLLDLQLFSEEHRSQPFRVAAALSYTPYTRIDRLGDTGCVLPPLAGEDAVD